MFSFFLKDGNRGDISLYTRKDISSKRLKKCIATERGLSDLYKLVVTIMNNTYKKLKPKIIICFTYKSFSNDSFRKALKQMVSNEDNGDGNFGIFNHLL